MPEDKFEYTGSTRALWIPSRSSSRHLSFLSVLFTLVLLDRRCLSPSWQMRQLLLLLAVLLIKCVQCGCLWPAAVLVSLTMLSHDFFILFHSFKPVILREFENHPPFGKFPFLPAFITQKPVLGHPRRVTIIVVRSLHRHNITINCFTKVNGYGREFQAGQCSKLKEGEASNSIR